MMQRIICVLQKALPFFYKRVAVPHPDPIRCKNSGEIAVTTFQHCMWDGEEIRQVKLYSRQSCAKGAKSANLYQDFCP